MSREHQQPLSPIDDEDRSIGVCTVDRDHSWCTAVFFATGLALSVFSDILQYSMPLAFLPSALEDQGYTNMQIATAVGIYYWTGFVVTLCIACFHIGCVLYETPGHRPLALDAKNIKIHIVYAQLALTGGTVTLFLEGLHPVYTMHLCCRFIQGGCGGVIFIFVFLTACELFKGQQQIFSLTMISVMFNVAEVLGPYCGAIVNNYFGTSAVFYLLGTLSVIIQCWFLAIIFCIREKWETSETDETDVGTTFSNLPQRSYVSKESGFARLKTLMTSRHFAISVLLITSSAAIKGAVEECLPFHADHEWNKQPLQIGEFFSVIAVAYICASAIVGQSWSYLNCGVLRTCLCGMFLMCLGVAGWCLFNVRTMGGDITGMYCALAFYGASLGFTFTPATLLLGEAVESEDAGAAKDATNSIWNTMWEAGGSFGFLLGGLLADSYRDMVSLMLGLGICCFLAAIGVIVLSCFPITKKELDSGYSDPNTRMASKNGSRGGSRSATPLYSGKNSPRQTKP